ncbi:hypothetical protein QBC45DRAFT_217776 [Copromyces sp. CBS 386.78]|nr:hypothetical protein QBC45DRAFT_217776 [Copromyces sp. CBS 386.78]
MFRGGSAKPDQGADGSRKPSQSPEAQRLYNQMRDVEEECKHPGRFREALRQREQEGQNNISHSPYLGIPTPHRRSRSRTGSTGPASTQGSDGGVEDSGRKKRGHRTKPLDEPQRLRTAFVRTYVGACGECRQRKVKCTHFDNSELEANYQASRRSRLSVAPMSPSFQTHISPPVSYSPVTVQCPNELSGVGSHILGSRNQPIVDYNHENRDDDIELDSPSTLVNTSVGGLFLFDHDAPATMNPAYTPYSSTHTNLLGFDDSYTPFDNSYPVSPMPSLLASSVGDIEKPLGSLINGSVANNIIWECKRGSIDPWTLTRTDSGPHECRARFPNEVSFLDHYRTQHEPFFNERIVHRCSCCGSFAGPYDQSCTKCANKACRVCDPTWPLASWYYGTMKPPAPSLMSGTTMIRTGQGFGNGLLGPPSYFGGSNSYGTSPNESNSFGIYGGSSYAGSTSNQTFGTTSKETAETRRFERYAPLQHQVSSNHDAFRHHHDENSISVKPTREDRPREPPSDYHHFSRKSPKCSAPPTTLSLIAKSTKSLNVNIPCLALVHLILLLLFPLVSSDTDNTTTYLSSSLAKQAAEHMPLVSAVCITIGVLGIWLLRSRGHVVGDDVSVDEGRSTLPKALMAS